MITLITPTGDRPEAFALCEYWMSRQTSTEDVQWIVVDDGSVPTCVTQGQEYVRRTRKPGDTSHSLGVNLEAAIPLVKGKKILIIEDDDYYSKTYVETMSRWLEDHSLVGERGAKYYHLNDQSYRFWKDHKHASLCRTGFRAELLPHLKLTIRKMKPGDWRIDLSLWENYHGNKKAYESSSSGRAICVGIKQMPGRVGVTHKGIDTTRDPDLSKLKEWLGDDFAAYSRFCNSKTSDFITYTCLFGGYDQLNPATNDNSYAVCYEGEMIRNGWKPLFVPRTGRTPKMESRFWKMNSHLAFPGKETLYLDANIRLILPAHKLASHMRTSGCEFTAFRHNKSKRLSQEVKEVIRIGFASKDQVDTKLTRKYSELPVVWGGCILRSQSDTVARANALWWRLFSAMNYGRDQVVLPIILTRSGISYSAIDEPTPFYGEASQWMRVMPHLRRRRIK